MNTIKVKIEALWNEFLFAKVSPLPIALFRILIGAFVFTDMLALFPSRLIWWSEHGILSSQGAIAYFPQARLSLLYLLPTSDAAITGFCIFVMLCGLSMMLGFFSRISCALVFLCLTSLAHRDPLILNSGDGFMRVSAFWLMWTGCGQMLSLDRKFFYSRKSKEYPLVETWNLRLPQIQFTIVYLMTFLFKMQGGPWVNGSAVGYIVKLQEFKRFPIPDFMFQPILIQMATYGTLAIEGALGTLIWIPILRPWVVLAGLSLHIGIEYSMNIPLFEWIMMGSLVLFVSEQNWIWLRKKLRISGIDPSPSL